MDKMLKSWKMDCKAVAFAPKSIKFNEYIGRERDYGRYNALEKLKSENPDLPTTSFHCDYWD